MMQMKTQENKLPNKGGKPDDILSSLREMKAADARWDNGKMFAFVYTPEKEAAELMHEVCRLYFFDNALSPTHFPSLAQLEAEVVSMASGLLHGGENTVGNITTGGTESILMAMKTARDHALRKDPNLKDLEVILPWSVHPAFHKAAHILGVKPVTLPLGDDYRADLTKMPRLVNEHTFMLVGSSPSYSHGVIDPIEEMACFALQKGLYFHVDACLGGFFLPFMEMLGYPVPLFDFRIPGVTSISADLHKYGYGSKGASVILYRDRQVRRDQFFVHCDWPGGLYGSPTMLGSRSGVPVAVAWAMLKYHGLEGYMELTRKTMQAVEKLRDGIAGIEGLSIAGDPVMSVFSFTSSRDDIYRIGDELKARGWVLDSIMHPEALHFIISYQNLTRVENFLEDLKAAVEMVRTKQKSSISSGVIRSVARRLMKMSPSHISSLMGRMAARSARSPKSKRESGSSVFYGIAASMANKGGLNKLVLDFLDNIYSV
jgi:glutamate/tyrosine decarboxylase-like PLP-dependent enzyme